MRAIDAAFADPCRGSQTRASPHKRFGPGSAGELKALLAAAPLDVALDRPRDVDREPGLRES